MDIIFASISFALLMHLYECKLYKDLLPMRGNYFKTVIALIVSAVFFRFIVPNNTIIPMALLMLFLSVIAVLLVIRNEAKLKKIIKDNTSKL